MAEVDTKNKHEEEESEKNCNEEEETGLEEELHYAYKKNETLKKKVTKHKKKSRR